MARTKQGKTPRTTSLLDWWPAHGQPGQRDAGRALARAFADVASRPEYRVCKVRDALRTIAEAAHAQYAGKADAKADAPKADKSKAKGKAKGSAKAAKAKADADALAYRCGTCEREIAAGMRSVHEATAKHRRLTALRDAEREAANA